MSADIWIVAPACSSCGRGESTEAEMNLTYNLSPMLWGAGMPSWSHFVGMSARDAGLIWEAVANELESNPALYRTLNPANGWGTYEQAVKTLREFAQECHRASPDAVIEASL